MKEENRTRGRHDDAPAVWVVLDDGVPVGMTNDDPLQCGWSVLEGRAFRRYVPQVRLNGLATDEEVELDRYLRERLNPRPPQSIDDAAHAILAGFIERGGMTTATLEFQRFARAALALFDPRVFDGLERCRRAAAILRGAT